MASPFLKIWLGPDFVKYVPLLWLLTGHLVINLSIQPLYAVSNACNKVKIPGIFTLLMGLLNVILAITLAYTTNLGVYSIALAGAIALTLKSGIFIPIYSAHVINISKITFIKPIITGLLLTISIFVISFLFSHFVNIHNWVGLIGYSCLICFPFIPIIWFYIINKSERDLIKSITDKFL